MPTQTIGNGRCCTNRPSPLILGREASAGAFKARPRVLDRFVQIKFIDRQILHVGTFVHFIEVYLAIHDF